MDTKNTVKIEDIYDKNLNEILDMIEVEKHIPIRNQVATVNALVGIILEPFCLKISPTTTLILISLFFILKFLVSFGQLSIIEKISSIITSISNSIILNFILVKSFGKKILSIS